jgi:hypothetical protein
MRGHEPLIALRRSGKRPSMVFIDAFEDSSDSWRDWPKNDPAHAQLEVLPDDSIPGLDLRCVVGLPVMVTGHSKARVDAIRDACIEAGAKRVVAACIDDAKVAITDTDERIKRERDHA